MFALNGFLVVQVSRKLLKQRNNEIVDEFALIYFALWRICSGSFKKGLYSPNLIQIHSCSRTITKNDMNLERGLISLVYLERQNKWQELLIIGKWTTISLIHLSFKSFLVVVICPGSAGSEAHRVLFSLKGQSWLYFYQRSQAQSSSVCTITCYLWIVSINRIRIQIRKKSSIRK